MYLAGVKDLYTKELVGYAINKRMPADLVCRALNMAIKNKGPSQGLIVHSDRGSQYCSHAYHKITKTIKQDLQPSAISLAILSCTTTKRGFRRAWAIKRQDRCGLTFTVKLRN